MPVTRTFDGTDWVPLTAAAAGSGTVSHTDLINIESDSHHARYTNSEAVTAMGAKASTNALNHDRYANSEAVTAMGAKSATNPLNHDRYTDANARTAVDNGTYLKLAGGIMTGQLTLATMVVRQGVIIFTDSAQTSATQWWLEYASAQLRTNYGPATQFSAKINGVGMQMFAQNPDSSVVRNIVAATVGPTGGGNGDVWLVYS